EALEVDRDVEAPRPEPPDQAPHPDRDRRRAAGPPELPPPQPRVDVHHVVEVGIVEEDRPLAPLDHPRQLGARPPRPERVGRRQGMDDVPQGGELHQRDPRGPLPVEPHRAGPDRSPKRARMTAMTSRVAWRLGSPAIATRPATAATLARSGTVAVV